MKWVLGLLALAVALCALGAAWLLGTEAGLRWAAAQAAAAAQGRLALDGLRGALAGDIAFDEIRYRDGATDVRLAQGELRLELLAVLGGRAGVRSLRAEELDISLGDGGGRPAAKPSLPLGLRIQRAEIGRLRFGELTIHELELDDAVLGAQGAVSGSASFEVREPRYPARVRVQAGGTLERIDAGLSATVAEVPVTAQAVLTPFAPRPLQSLKVRAGPADLSRLDPAWPNTALTLEMSGTADAGQALAGTLALRNAQPGTLDRQRLPFETLDARFATDFTALSLHDLRITGAGTLSGSARIAPKQAQLELRAAGLDLRALRSTLRRTRLSGPLTIVATKEAQQVKGTLAQDGMSLSADAVRSGEVVQVRSVRAAAEGGEASGSGRLLLGQPMRFEAKLRLARFDPARFGDYPEGSINGDLAASGTLQETFEVDARWDIRDSRLRGEALASHGTARILRERVARANAQASLGRARLSARGDFGSPGDELALELESAPVAQVLEGWSGTLSASARLTGSWASPRGSLQAKAAGLAPPNGVRLESLALSAQGSLAKHEGEVLLRGEGLDMAAQLRGGWHASAGWTGEITGLRNRGAYPLQLEAAAPLTVAPGRVELGRLQAKLGKGRLRVEGLSWSPSRLASSGEFTGLPAQWLVVAGGLTDRLRATMLLDGRWDLSAAPRVDGTLSVRRSSGDLLADDFALGLDKAELEARFTDGVMQGTAALASRYGTAEVRGTLQGLQADAPVDFTARVRFAELRALLQPLLEGARMDGRLRAELRGSGTLSELRLAGSVEGDAISLQMPPYGIFLKDGEVRAALEGDRLRITRLSISGSGGELTASGVLPLRPSAGDAQLEWRAREFGLLARPDLRLTVSGDGEARLSKGKVSLSGALRADRGYLELEQDRLPQLGGDVVIEGQPRTASNERARLPVALDIQLDLGEQLQVRGYGLEGRLAGQLQVETTAEGELRAYGRIQAVNATFRAYGQRLEVDPGIAIFDGPLDNPSLQLTAWRRNQQVEAGVQVSGTARAPRVQLVSQPPVPEGERLSWLVLGRAPGDATKADLGLLQAAAGALLARGDRMPLDRRIAQAFGVDEISLRGSGEVGDRVVAVGKRLSDRLYVSYEQGLGIVASALVKLDLALTQRLSVRAETGTSSGVGLFYRFSWD